jgi:hypothetical protein
MFDSQNRLNHSICRAREHAAACAPKPLRKGEPLSFLRHGEIYRSDVGLKTILGLWPSAASRWSALGRNLNGCGFDAAPIPSSAMSLGLGIPWQVALQQSLPPLPHPEPLCNDEKSSVEQFSADGACLTAHLSQNSTQFTHIL